ncbi:type IV pilus modification PilV family protein [Arcobacter sp. YIC-464]|uniref:type IV pilus modification PilV family protein n=1 Tax=Arcobacter sp. YIC-464 TaxID=3376631 RepID=UPI003C28783C
MKKSFSLMEVIVAVMVLSVVMVALLQVKSDNIFLISKADETKEFKEYLSMAFNLDEVESRNENIFLSRKFDFEDDKLRRELKSIKVKVKDELIDTKLIKNDSYDFNVVTYETSYSIDKKVQKKIYSFKIEL